MSRGVVWTVFGVVVVLGLLIYSGWFASGEAKVPDAHPATAPADSRAERLVSLGRTGAPSPEMRDRSTGRRLDSVSVAWRRTNGESAGEGTTTEDGRLCLPAAGVWHLQPRSDPPSFLSATCSVTTETRLVEVDAIGVVHARAVHAPVDAEFRLVPDAEFGRAIGGEPPTDWFEAVAEVGLPPTRVHGNGAEWDAVPLGEWRVVCAGRGLERVIPAVESWRGEERGQHLVLASRAQDETCPASARLTVDPGGLAEVEVRFGETATMTFRLESFAECEFVRIVPRIRRVDQVFEGWDEASVQWEGKPEEPMVTLAGLIPAEYRVDVYGWRGSELRCGSVVHSLRAGESPVFGMDQMPGPYSLTWTISGVGEARWLIENLAADERAAGVDGLAIAGEKDFSSVDRITVTGLPHLSGLLQLIPLDGAMRVQEYDLSKKTGY